MNEQLLIEKSKNRAQFLMVSICDISAILETRMEWQLVHE